MFQLFFILLFIFPLSISAQGSGGFSYPVINEPLITIVVDKEKGSDTSREASELSPLASFDSVFTVLVNKTKGLKGDIPCAVHIKKGHYVLKETVEQTMSSFMPSGSGGPKLHISFIGIDDSVIMDGSPIKRVGGYGLLRICGSNVRVSNLTILNAPSFGLVLGQTFARSKNVIVEQVIVKKSYCHGILLGDIDSKEQDTVLIKKCSFIETNTMNAQSSNTQWGSGLKLFGASHVLVDSCYFYSNWSEAISINDSKYVRITRSTFIDNFAPSVYCDIAQYVTVDRNMFLSTNDSTIFKTGKRGMVAVLLSNEAWSGTAIDHFTRGVDIHSNIMINQSGALDIWEGAVSFIQKAYVQNIRFAFNSCFGMSSGKGSTNAGFITTVYSTPFPPNRILNNLLIYGNIFSADPSKWSPNIWFRTNKDIAPAFIFRFNRWNRTFPGFGNFTNDDNAILPDSFSLSMLDLESLKKKVPSLSHVLEDFDGRKRNADSTMAGAFELSNQTGISNLQTTGNTLIFDYFPQERFIKPQHWQHGRIFCIDLLGKVRILEDELGSGIIPLPGKGPYFILQQQ